MGYNRNTDTTKYFFDTKRLKKDIKHFLINQLDGIFTSS
ncbi:hypothetical protein FVB9288_00453 [Flavobacterium sp. CECT 9288]|nr:hypothetical protein FVB9288_00453 [Flavobacterium sp. CECT 9288]